MTETKPPIAPKSQETLASLISRYATHYWVDATTYCSDKGVSFKAVLQQSKDTVDHLREYGVEIPEMVLDWSPRALCGKKYSFRNHEFPTKILKSPEIRGCPECLRNDLEGGANHMALRGDWHVPHVTICVRHKTPLVPLWREGNQTRRYDSAPHLNALIPHLCNGELDAEPRKVLDFDLWLHSRLMGTKSTDNWLDQHSIHAACNFSRYLGAALLRLDNIPLTRIQKQDYPLLYEMGFQVARMGEETILNTFEAIQRKPGSPQDGAKAIFPLLYERLAYDHQNDPAYAPFHDLLRHHMAATWPLGPGDELLGKPVTVRRMHSVRTAALHCGIDQRRMRKVLAAKQFVPAPGQGLPDTWEVFDAVKAAPVLNQVKQFISAKEMAASINATRSQFDLLVADEVLSPALNDQSMKAVWNPADGQAFLDSLLRGAIQLRQAQHGWEHISKSAQRLKIRPGEIVAAIRNGEIRHVGNRMGWEGYKSIHVYHDDVVAALRPTLLEAKSIEIFAKAVGMHQPSKLKLMIGDGHVQTSILTNPITKKRQIYFTPDDEDVFHSRFLTPKTLALEFGETSRMIIRKLRQANIEPVSAHDLRYGSVYSREEVENVLK